jgi:hypothetical protein
VVFYVGVALMVVLGAAWISSVIYLRTERGRARREQLGGPDRDRTRER